MSKVIIGELSAGYIFGDHATKEYVYLPAGEVGSSCPLCVIERGDAREDISCDEAARLIQKLTLKPVSHPRLGRRVF